MPRRKKVCFMKKKVVIVCIALVALFCIFSSLHVEITPEKAVEYTKQMLDERSKANIKNIDNPKIEDVVFNETPSIYLFEEKSEIVGRKLYRIIYNTEQDGLLGPIVFYVDKLNGKIVGMDYRG